MIYYLIPGQSEEKINYSTACRNCNLSLTSLPEIQEELESIKRLIGTHVERPGGRKVYHVSIRQLSYV